MKTLESFESKKFSSLDLSYFTGGACGGSGSSDDPIQLETVVVTPEGGGRDGCE